MAYRERHPLAGQTVKLKPGIGMGAMGDDQFTIEDWAENVLGVSVWMANGNPAALEYALRAGTLRLPHDNNCIYGKIGMLGHIIHESEIVMPD